MKKKLFALALCLVLTGCGTAPLPETTEPVWEDFPQEDQPQEEPVVYPDVFSLAYHKDNTLNPINCGEGIQQDVASLLYEPLFRLNEQFEPVGVLCAAANWDESGLVCTLYVRESVLFSDGSELKAADVAAALQRAKESRRYGYRLRLISGVTYSNRNGTVTITLLEKNSALLSLLDIPVVKKGTEGQLVPIGTGPYVYAAEGEEAKLVANELWWQQKGIPVESIRLVHAKDADTAIHMFVSDRAQLLTLDPTDGTSAISGETVETERPTTQMHFIGFNTASGVFADSAARIALNMGIRRDVLVDAFLSNHAIPAQFPISPLSGLYPAGQENAYNREAFLAAVEAAGYNTGETRELILLVNEENSFRVDNARYLAETLSVMDWKITVRTLPWTEYLVALHQGEFDLYYGQVRLSADWDITDLIASGGTMNYGGFADIQMDQYVQEFREASDRKAAVTHLYNYYSETMPMAVICFQNYIVLTHPNVVENITTAPENTFHAFENWTIRLSA